MDRGAKRIAARLQARLAHDQRALRATRLSRTKNSSSEIVVEIVRGDRMVTSSAPDVRALEPWKGGKALHAGTAARDEEIANT